MILPVPEPVPMPQECNFTKKETLAHVDIFLFFEFLIFFLLLTRTLLRPRVIRDSNQTANILCVSDNRY